MNADEMLALFDALEPVAIEAMIGTWRGEEVPTAHPLDGLLAGCGWYGKRFDDDETCYPLLMLGADGREVWALDPGRLPGHLGYLPRVPLPRNLRWAVLAARALLETHEPRARLRLVEHRGKLGAAMIYDDKPIIDHFRREGADTLLGLMDLRGMARPFFFRLRRE